MSQRNRILKKVWTFFILVLLWTNMAASSEKSFETFDPDNARNWSFFTDGVMGGISQGKAFYGKSGSDNFVRLQGKVSTENNGGFIQIRHSLTKSLDSDVRGVSLKVRGNGEKYYVFIRTRSTILPWQFYNSGFKTSKDWRIVNLNFETFQRSSNFLRKAINSSSIKSIGIVAYGRDHNAKIDVSEINFFK
ncbi:CIA30 family protein [Paracoccaceae bacterium]|nr:CIA30 family protein [Paracoccaceae bacterium]